VNGAPRFLITGSGHSGTAYIGEVLWRSGVRCGHEQWFGAPGGDVVADLDGDASWVALLHPWLNKFRGEVFHQVREPLSTIGSLARFYAEAPRDTYMDLRLRWLEAAGWTGANSVGRATATWVTANEAAAGIARFTYRVEDLAPATVRAIASAAGRDVGEATAADAIRSTPTDLNAHNRHDVGWEDVRRFAGTATCERARVMARAYGYQA